MTSYRSQIVLGQQYQDKQTKFIGHATAVVFYQHGCERVTLKGMNGQGEIVEYGFDSPEVELIREGRLPKAVELIRKKPGGPHGSAPATRR